MTEETGELILAAFAQARRNGVRDWRRMHASELRRAVVVLSNGSFAERMFGVTLFSEVLSRFKALVTVDRSPEGLMVELAAHACKEVAEPSGVSAGNPAFIGKFIRRDIWAAFANTRAACRFFWDPAQAMVRNQIEAGLIPIPPIDPTTMSNWRTEFASQVSGLDPEEQRALARWSQSHGFLPPSLFEQWRRLFAKKVRARARDFFATNDTNVFKRAEVEPSVGSCEGR